MTIWRMRVACWITKATLTRLWYVILIDFPLQQWRHECTSVLRYMHIARLDSMDLCRRRHHVNVAGEYMTTLKETQHEFDLRDY